MRRILVGSELEQQDAKRVGRQRRSEERECIERHVRLSARDPALRLFQPVDGPVRALLTGSSN